MTARTSRPAIMAGLAVAMVVTVLAHVGFAPIAMRAEANVAAAAPGGDVALGEYLAGECVTCHRVDGKDQGIPSIVGWEQGHFVAVMHSYRDKVRDNPVMQTIAGRYGDAEVAALAAYFATLQRK